MLLVYRCISNFIEAFPPCQLLIIKYKGVKILINKLIEIEYIDLAEHILSVSIYIYICSIINNGIYNNEIILIFVIYILDFE